MAASEHHQPRLQRAGCGVYSRIYNILFPLYFYSVPVPPVVDTASALNTTRVLGENATFHVTLKHTPYPLADIVWTHNESPVNTSSDRMQLSSDGVSLRLTSLTPSDAGVYTVLVKNSLGSDNVTFTMDVQGKC